MRNKVINKKLSLVKVLFVIGWYILTSENVLAATGELVYRCQLSGSLASTPQMGRWRYPVSVVRIDNMYNAQTITAKLLSDTDNLPTATTDMIFTKIKSSGSINEILSITSRVFDSSNLNKTPLTGTATYLWGDITQNNKTSVPTVSGSGGDVYGSGRVGVVSGTTRAGSAGVELIIAGGVTLSTGGSYADISIPYYSGGSEYTGHTLQWDITTSGYDVVTNIASGNPPPTNGVELTRGGIYATLGSQQLTCTRKITTLNLTLNPNVIFFENIRSGEKKLVVKTLKWSASGVGLTSGWSLTFDVPSYTGKSFFILNGGVVTITKHNDNTPVTMGMPLDIKRDEDTFDILLNSENASSGLAETVVNVILTAD